MRGSLLVVAIAEASSVSDIRVGQELALRRRRRGAGRGDGAVDQRGNLVVDGIERIGFEQCRLADPEAENLQTVALLAQFSDLVLAAIELGVAGMVAVEAAGIDLDRAGAAARAGAFDRLARRLVNGEEIVAADLDRGQPETGGAARGGMAAHRLIDPGPLAHLVVPETRERRH